MFRVALISRWHPHAQRYYPEIKTMPDAEYTCVWDEDPVRGKAWADELGIDFEPDYDKVLARPDVDGIVVTAQTNLHPQIFIKAAEAHKHIFTEKVLTITTAEASVVRDKIKQAGIKFQIAFLRRGMPAFALIKRLADGGIFGEISMARVRNGHNQLPEKILPAYWCEFPEVTGGGAMIDLGAHPIYLLDWILGVPVEVNATYANLCGTKVEDSAVATMRFANNAIGIAESTNCGYNTPYMFEVYGTKASIFVKWDWRIENSSNIFLSVDESKIADVERIVGKDAIIAMTPTLNQPTRKDFSIDETKLPTSPSPIRQWVTACIENTETDYGIDEAYDLTKILDACNIAAREHRTVML